MPDEHPGLGVNNGVILGQREEDYVAGGSPIPYVVRVEDGNWSRFLPPGENQSSPFLETMACVSFSALNAIEAQYKLLTGLERNFSDRFTALMSGTTASGNFLWKVGDSIRRDGLVDESLWPTVAGMTWNQYYTPPPMEVIDIGRQFLQTWSVQYEWVPSDRESLRHHLKHAPIQVVIPGHAVLHFFNEGDIQKYFDSYRPYIKEYQLPFVTAMKIVLTKKKKMVEQEIKWLYALSFYREPTEVELSYWLDRPLLEFLNTAINDRSKFLDDQTPNIVP